MIYQTDIITINGQTSNRIFNIIFFFHVHTFITYTYSWYKVLNFAQCSKFTWLFCSMIKKKKKNVL